MTRVLFEGTRAVGVEFVDGRGDVQRRVADQEVIFCELLLVRAGSQDHFPHSIGYLGGMNYHGRMVVCQSYSLRWLLDFVPVLEDTA